MARLLTIEAEYICYKCEQKIGKHRSRACAFRSSGNEYCERMKDIDLMIHKLLRVDCNSDNGDKTVQEQ